MSTDKLDEIASRGSYRIDALGESPGRVIRAALAEAVAEERRALREIVGRVLEDRSYAFYRAQILAAREAKP